MLETILTIVRYRSGITDAQLAFSIFGRRDPRLVALECEHLEEAGRLKRRPRQDGFTGNFFVG